MERRMIGKFSGEHIMDLNIKWVYNYYVPMKRKQILVFILEISALENNGIRGQGLNVNKKIIINLKQVAKKA